VNSKYRWRPKRVLLGRVRLRRSTRPFLTSICHARARLTATCWKLRWRKHQT